MVTAAGFNAPATCAALRAGVSGITKVNLWDWEGGKHLNGGKVDLPQWSECIDKLADLVAPAIHECLVAAQPQSPRNIPLLLGVAPLDRPERNPEIDTRILEEISFRLEVPLHPASIVLPSGRVSAVQALRQSAFLLADPRISCCIISGVDSFMHQSVAEAYMNRRRLLTSKNSNGFTPGEAGTAMLVRPADAVDASCLEVLGTGMARELATVDSSEPLRGEGITAAIDEALTESRLTIFDASYRITDINGEHYMFKEALIGLTRFEHGRKRVELFDLWHPAEYIGETGAAIGPCVFGWALHSNRKEYAPGPVALCHFSNDDGERAATIVRYRSGRESNG
jgi:3-oxoacyl-[acyl-carrier-protein] synthase-1